MALNVRLSSSSALRRAAAAACASGVLGAQAQTIDPVLAPVTVQSATSARTADISGFGDVPLQELPLSATVISAETLQQTGVRRLSEVSRIDASISDAYNAPGYWDFLTVRGFVLDNRSNYRREGLPISAETSIPLDNKDRLEILRGTSGIQAGVSAPGGLVNYVVKRPTETPLRAARIDWTSRASVLAALDLGGRAGPQGVFGYRLNVAHEDLRPHTQHLKGHRDLVSLATDWRISRDTLLEAEGEWSQKVQPSQAGFSLLGGRLPAPVNPALNLNNQPWSQASVFDAFTGSMRWTQILSPDWRWSAQVGTQRLRTDDRMAFPYGCSNDNIYDRFCSNGTYDLYDFRSENERRRQHAAALRLQGKLRTGSVVHDLGLGLTWSQTRVRMQDQAYNWVGFGNVAGTQVLPPDPTLTDPNTQRDERALEWSLQDAIHLNERWTTWFGLRSTALVRNSVRTNGTRATHYDTHVHTPWAAVTYALAPATHLYASYGEGVESQVVPNKSSQYTNPGVAMPPLKSRQWELGAKGARSGSEWQVNAFRIRRPMTNLDACNRLGITPCLGQHDGAAVHTGLEVAGQHQMGNWIMGGGLTLLRARREGSQVEPGTNGQPPANVPSHLMRVSTAWNVPFVPGLQWSLRLQREGRRAVLADNSISLPAWNRWDTALRYATRVAGHGATWWVGIDNLLDRRYWQESPYQFGHVYLFPAAARTARVSLQIQM